MSFHFPGKLAGFSKHQRHLYRLLRRFGTDEEGALRLIGSLVSSGPNAAVGITLIDGSTDVVAPYAAFLRATGFSGFQNADGSPLVEPPGDTNVYDPTQHRLFLLWDFDDPGYAFVRNPNIPDAWRDLNVGYGRQVAHVYHTPREPLIRLYVFDLKGNWATATYKFGSGGQSPAIADPNTFPSFAGANTIVWSQSGNFIGAPVGATQCTTIAQVHDAMRARMNAGNRSLRVLMRAGETFLNNWFFSLGDGVSVSTGFGYPLALGASAATSYNYRDNMKGCHFNRFGTGARPAIRYTASQTKPPISFPDRTDCRQLVLSDLDFGAGWDAATETGRAGWAGDIAASRGLILMTRSKWDGFADGMFDRQQIERGLVYHDCEVTNWNNYAAYCDTRRIAMLGCDIYQKLDALGGIGQMEGSQNPTTLGNRHSCFRSGVRNYETVMSCNSFLSRNGWYPVGGGGTTYGASAEQPCLRLWSHFSAGGINVRRHYHVFERNSFEGGDTVIACGPGPNYNQGQFDHEINPKNALFDKNIIVGGPRSYAELMGITVSGVTVRNCFFRRTGVQIAHPNTVRRDLRVNFWSNPLLGDGTRGPVEIYNNTLLDDAPAANTIRGGDTFDAAFVPFSLAPGHAYFVENNVTRVVNRPGHEGAAFLPLGTDPIAGFVLRHQGSRFNFMPVRIGVGAARLNEVGTSGDWAPGTWVRMPYPNQTGQCAGAGQQLTQALVTGNSTQWHQMSIPTAGEPSDSRNLTDAVLAPGSKGGLTFDFTPTAMRVRNDGTRTFTASQEIWLLLDQRDRLMAPQPGTSQAGQTLPLAVPGDGSAAILGAKPAIGPRETIMGALRAGSLTTAGAVTTGQHRAGAF